jgi:hypothetical protein
VLFWLGVSGKRPVPWLPGRQVGEHGNAAARCGRAREPERGGESWIVEDPPAAPEHNRVDQDLVLVDQRISQQRSDELRAAVDLQFPARQGLEPGNLAGDIPADHS